MDKISIIIPVYNAEKYLEECLNSIINQSFKNWELILVIDGATDNSLSICERYKEKFTDKIKVILKENGGVSSARNIGLQNITGNFVCFVDADDYVEKEYLEKLYNNIKINEADLSVCSSYFLQKRHKKRKFKSKEQITIFDQKSALKEIFAGRLFGGYLWQKLFRTDLIKDLKFDTNIHYGEDLLFSCEYLNKCAKIVFTNQKLYHYISNGNSFIHTKFSSKKATIITCLEKLIERYKDEQDIQIYAKSLYFLENLEIFYYLLRDRVKNKSLKSQIKLNMKQNVKYIKKCNKFSFVKRVLCPFAYLIIKNF